ncbi:MAG: sigma-54 dependent transcriptional regulator [Flavobacteriales bacterium]|nr:sigma-54 dependent transcriptional regulator [Flavobacteriales bacterium]
MQSTQTINIQEIKQRFGIIGTNSLLDRAIEKATIVAPTDISVLVSGESGVGKENIPRIIHSLSYRKHKPYIAVNCGAIPEGTIESELFGHEKGAFTGAAGVRKGYFEVADGGTIFLDEVGELPLMTQVRLLRVLETGEFMKVGSSTTQKTDVRVVAATNRDLLRAIHEGNFREDLYYRLNTVEINLPPLRGRKEDIHLLFRKFASDFAQRYNMPPVRLSDDAVDTIKTFPWPGNIRQLRNFTEQISIMESNKYVDASGIMTYLPKASFGENLPSTIHHEAPSQDVESLSRQLLDLRSEVSDLKRVVASILENSNHQNFASHSNIIDTHPTPALPPFQPMENEDERTTDIPFSLDSSNRKIIDISHDEDAMAPLLQLEKNEIQMIRMALEKYKGRRKDATRELGISERTLYRKIKQYNLDS